MLKTTLLLTVGFLCGAALTANAMERLTDKQYTVLAQIADQVTNGGGQQEVSHWQINPEKLAIFLAADQATSGDTKVSEKLKLFFAENNLESEIKSEKQPGCGGVHYEENLTVWKKGKKDYTWSFHQSSDEFIIKTLRLSVTK